MTPPDGFLLRATDALILWVWNTFSISKFQIIRVLFVIWAVTASYLAINRDQNPWKSAAFIGVCLLIEACREIDHAVTPGLAHNLRMFKFRTSRFHTTMRMTFLVVTLICGPVIVLKLFNPDVDRINSLVSFVSFVAVCLDIYVSSAYLPLDPPKRKEKKVLTPALQTSQ